MLSCMLLFLFQGGGANFKYEGIFFPWGAGDELIRGGGIKLKINMFCFTTYRFRCFEGANFLFWLVIVSPLHMYRYSRHLLCSKPFKQAISFSQRSAEPIFVACILLKPICVSMNGAVCVALCLPSNHKVR